MFIGQPQVLAHIDYRLDNMCFSVDGSELALFDWGDYCIGPPGFDIAHFLVTSCSVASRRQWEQQILKTYHDTLVDAGVRNYSFTQCMDSYRLCLPPAFYMSALLTTSVHPVTKRVAKLARELLERSTSAIHDHIDWLESVYGVSR